MVIVVRDLVFLFLSVDPLRCSGQYLPSDDLMPENYAPARRSTVIPLK
jgi:hypothetical protein